MGLGDFHKHRRVASLCALIGVLLYTALVPGHVISQATAPASRVLALDDEFGVVIEMSCHSGIAVARDPSAPAEPAVPEKKCPFCKGYAAFMTALPGACDTGILDAERVHLEFAARNEGLTEQVALRPHNRGPPTYL